MTVSVQDVIAKARHKIGSAESVPTGAETMERRDINQWLQALSRDLLALRRETHEQQWWDRVRDNLIERRFTWGDVALAEDYILRGTRYPAMRPTLLGDFFPSKEQIESIGITVINKSELPSIIRKIRDEERRRADAEAYQKYRADNPDAVALGNKVMNLEWELRKKTDTISEYASLILKHEATIADLQRQVETLQATTTEQSSEGNPTHETDQ